MSESELVDTARQALLIALIISSPILLVGLLAGIASGFLQAITQIHDQALSFAPKLIVVLVALSVLLPWMMGYLGEFAVDLFSLGS